MSSYIGIILFVLMFIFGLLVVGGTIFLIVKLVKNKEKKINLQINTLLHIYLYVISFITLGVALIGTNMLIRAGASYKFGIPFSYETYEYHKPLDPSQLKEDMGYIEPECYEGKKMEISGETVCFDDTLPKKGIINGATLTISMLLIFAIHRIAIYYLEKKEKIMWLKKAYTFASLIGYSALSIISIPIAMYLTLNYIYFRPEELFKIEAPGGAIALALASIPLWIVFLISTLKLREAKEEKK